MSNKQKLQEKFKNIPADTPQVCGSITPTLNKAERPGVQGKVRTCNNGDVGQAQRTARPVRSFVFVLNCQGEPLMPTTFAKSKRLVRKGKARLVRRNPFFVIQLTKECRNQKQNVILGIDSGYRNIGFSAVSDKKELVSGTLELDDSMKKRLLDRKVYRRSRRNRHHWYRKSRFNNRAHSLGWLPPSTQRRYDTHLALINKIKKILPISNTIIETANFDIQKIENPDILGKDYQQGVQLGFDNVKQYVLARDKRTCQYCGKKNTELHVHHIKFRSEGGTDRPDNLITLCASCHDKLHRGKISIKKSTGNYKPNIFMSIVQHRFEKDIPDAEITFGYITKAKRLNLGLEKTHYNDAFCIVDGYNQVRCMPISLKQKRKNNRKLQINRKGYKPSIRRHRYDIQPKDLVLVNNRWIETNGIQCYGQEIHIGKKSISVKKVQKVFHTKTIYGIYCTEAGVK